MSAQLEHVHGAKPGHGQVRARAEGCNGEIGVSSVVLKVHDVAVPTNMVVFEAHGYRSQTTGGGAAAGTAAFCEELRRRGVLVFPYGGRGDQIRYVCMFPRVHASHTAYCLARCHGRHASMFASLHATKTRRQTAGDCVCARGWRENTRARAFVQSRHCAR